MGTKTGGSFAMVLCLMLCMAAQTGWQVWQLHQADLQVEAITARNDTFQRWRALVQLNLSRALMLARSGFHQSLASATESQMKATAGSDQAHARWRRGEAPVRRDR